MQNDTPHIRAPRTDDFRERQRFEEQVRVSASNSFNQFDSEILQAMGEGSAVRPQDMDAALQAIRDNEIYMWMIVY
jgi:hypothetical protein